MPTLPDFGEDIKARSREQRLRRFKQIPLRILVPNLITLLALCSGVTAIRLGVEGRYVSLAADICRQTGLLYNDALLVATMREHGLTLLASNDADLDRVPGITRYAPG